MISRLRPFLIVIAVLFVVPGRAFAEKSSLTLGIQREPGFALSGTLFEIPGEISEAPQLSIGIQNVVQTGMPSYTELLTVFIRNGVAAVWRDLGKPFERGNFVWLVALDNQLIAIDRQDVAPPRKLITGDQPEWRPLTGAELGRLERYLQRQRSELRRPRVQSGPFSIQMLRAGTLEICLRTAPLGRACRQHSIPRDNDIVYAVASAENDTILFTNWAWFRVTRDGVLSTVWVQTAEPERSNQIYAALRSRYDVLLGHYPSGNVLRMVVSDKDLLAKPLSPNTPYTAPARQLDREVQSLAHYAGRLLAGVWPWGELYEFHADSGWVLVRRLFAAPEISNELSPYADAIHSSDHPISSSRVLSRLYSILPAWADFGPEKDKAGAAMFDPDVWGQRIAQLVPLGRSLYLATGNKSGEFQAKWLKFLPSPALASEYGKVYEMTSPGNLACNLQKQEGPVSLEFSIVRQHLEVRVGGKLLCVLSDPSVALAAKALHLAGKLGDGMYGKFIGGRVSLVRNKEVGQKERSDAEFYQSRRSHGPGLSLTGGSNVQPTRRTNDQRVDLPMSRDTHDRY